MPLEQKATVVFYSTSVSASLKVKKAVQSTRFFLFNKAIKYEEYDCHYDDGTRLGTRHLQRGGRSSWGRCGLCDS